MAGIIRIVIERGRDPYRGGWEVTLIDAAEGCDDRWFATKRDAYRFAERIAKENGLEATSSYEWGLLQPAYV